MVSSNMLRRVMGRSASFFVFLIWLSTAGLAKAEEGTCDLRRVDNSSIRFGSSLGCAEQQTLADDLARLHRFEPSDPDPETYVAIGSLNLSGQVLEVWLSERIDTIALETDGTSHQEGEALLEARRILSISGARATHSESAAGNSIRRLGSLFHRALHTDAAGGGHSPCAAAHDYAGRAACDAGESAAYRTEALILRELLKSCEDCTLEDRESLRLEIAERFLRAEEGSR